MASFWRVPMVILGEFDALEGAKAICALEYYGYQELDSFGPHVLRLYAVRGKAILSPRIVSGDLRVEYKERMKEVVSRVLSSNESDEESVVMLDPFGGGIASVSFCLQDILARGEKRRFCIIVTHPQSDELMRQWPLITCFLNILLEDWCNTTKQRQTSEYCEFSDLERRREEARKCSMRSLMFLISKKTESEEDSFKRIHIFFEHVLPTVFGPQPMRITEFASESACIDIIKRRIELELPLVSTVDINLDSPLIEQEIDGGGGGGYLNIHNGRILSLRESIIIKPLSVWFLELMKKNTSALHEMELLLTGLFSGIQILIFGDDSTQCANFACSLSQILPRLLRRVTVFAKKYCLPYESRIMGFNQQVSQKLYMKEERNKIGNEFGIKDIIFVKMDSIVGIMSIYEYGKEEMNTLTDTTLFSPSSYNNNNRREEKEEKMIPSIVKRIVDLFRSEVSSEIVMHVCKKLQIKIEQLVNEYVMLGQLYVKLYQQHEIKCNQVEKNAGVVSGTFFANVSDSVRHFFGDSSSPLWRSTLSISFPSSFPPRSSVSSRKKRVLKGDTAFLFSMGSMGESDFNTWVTTSADHDVLLFLGSTNSFK